MNVKIRALLLVLIFLNGYVSLSMELIALRQLSSFVGNTSVTASIVIGIFLAFMSWGYYKGSIIRLAKNNLRNIMYISFVIIAVMVVLSSSYVIVDGFFRNIGRYGLGSNVIKTFIYSLIFLSIAPYLFGLNTAIMARYLNKYSRNYTGKIMAVDTIGSVLGSLITTLVLMPVVGVNHTIVLVALCSLVGAMLVKFKKRDLLVFPVIVAIALFINNDSYLFKKYNMVENNAVSTILVKDANNGNAKIMFMNGAGASKYSKDDELLVPLVKYINETFIYTMPKDIKGEVLVLGAGGFTMGDKDKFHNYTFVDVDPSLQKVAEKHFIEKELSENKHFVVEDANQFLKDTNKIYDLIIIDTYSSLDYIPQDLVTVEFFSRVKSRLKEGGIVVMNIVTRATFNNEFSKKIDNTIHSVFGGNIQRQTIGKFNAWNANHNTNILYAVYNTPNSGSVYTHDKNSVIYDY